MLEEGFRNRDMSEIRMWIRFMRPTADIINDILDWRTSYDGQSLQEHLHGEMTKLACKTQKSASFREEYINRSGQLPSTMKAKLEDALNLISAFRNGKESLDDVDKGVISDMLEFLVVPFYHFSCSSRNTLSNKPLMDMVCKSLNDRGNIARNTRIKLEYGIGDYERLGNLLVELCDNQNYALAPTVRDFTHHAPQPFRGR